MNDSPGWAPPGSSPSDEPDHGAQQQNEPADQPAAEQRAWGEQWARRQPPPGRWAASGSRTPPPVPPAPGPGGGWGTGRRRPPAPRPGVIPLRPLGVSEILDGAVAIMRAHWRTVLGLSLIVSIVTQGLITAATGLWFNDGRGNESKVLDDPDATVGQALRAVGDTLGDSGVTLLLGVLGTIVTTALLTVVTARAVLGRNVSTREAWAGARPHLLQLCGLLVLIPTIAAAVIAAGMTPGLLLAVAGVPSEGAALASLGGLAAACVAAWLWVRFSLAAPALMLEKQGIIKALRRSFKLVRGSWGRVFGVQLLAVVLVFIVGAIIEIPTSLVAMVIGGDNAMDWLSGESVSVGWTFLIVVGVGGVISSTITFPISAGVTALLYMDQRIRREALDLELARAAGMPGDSTESHDETQPTVGSTSWN
ncbi:hypothetical protein JK364_46890 [Streptomyces sp. 110]|uniref:Glycerophosphoryl diester phosphodiesterase membrane domain-containing protein n=1 Tax=Streptomyces endocoffeicus TaxID=2898945 RepID=A0ABS1Q518_9ACTN|nr:hypothetical protein [Streptomyces endocoffeicus]MBL1119783.1 hypothetical protein [Streptomyces endocoffeicus]